MQNDWITLSTLGTFAGTVFAVTLISQFLKGAMDRIVKFPTRLLVLAIAWAVLLGRQYIMAGDLSFEGVFMDLLNGFMVSLSAMGVHSVMKENVQLWK